MAYMQFKKKKDINIMNLMGTIRLGGDNLVDGIIHRFHFSNGGRGIPQESEAEIAINSPDFPDSRITGQQPEELESVASEVLHDREMLDAQALVRLGRGGHAGLLVAHDGEPLGGGAEFDNYGRRPRLVCGGLPRPVAGLYHVGGVGPLDLGGQEDGLENLLKDPGRERLASIGRIGLVLGDGNTKDSDRVVEEELLVAIGGVLEDVDLLREATNSGFHRGILLL